MMTRNQKPYAGNKAIRGFTIVEMMIALAISTVLLFGVINIFMASRTSYSLQSGAARMQENARFALDNMARSIGMAGLGTAAVGLDAFTVNTADGGGTVSDTIEVNYEATTDCIGNNTAGAGGIATDLYQIQVIGGVSNLVCNGQPLIEGVENMQILYGEDSNGMPDGIADRYVSADAVSDWGSVNGGIASVRIALLLNTIDDVDEVRAQSYQLLDAPALVFNDDMLRRIYTRTILVRNYTYTP